MSFIDIEYDKFTLSTSPLFSMNYFPKKFYRLYQSTNSDDKIIINGSFLFNETNEVHLCNSPVKKESLKSYSFDFEDLDCSEEPECSDNSDPNQDIPYYKNIDKLFVYYKDINFYINTDRLEIENSSYILDNIVYQSNIKKSKNMKYRDFVIMSTTPVLINISYDTKSGSNFVRISCYNDTGCGGSAYSYLYDKKYSPEITSINCIQNI